VAEIKAKSDAAQKKRETEEANKVKSELIFSETLNL